MAATLMDAKAPPVEKRRQILDAAIHVFARQGFHACRVSDIADEAGVAYGLVYHYFKSKDEVLNELFTERWSLLLATIEEVDGQGISAREKLDVVARFIIDSYRHEPDLMKVIIVDVTRAANSFGRTHLAEIRRAYDLIAKIVADGQRAGTFRRDVDPRVRLDVVLRRDRAAPLGLGLRPDPRRRGGLRPRPGDARRDDLRRARGPQRRGAGAGDLMWESLGTTPRQDRLLHGAAKALNVVVGFLAAPLWLFGQRLSEPFRRLLARFDSEPPPLPIPQPRRALDGRPDVRPGGDPQPPPSLGGGDGAQGARRPVDLRACQPARGGQPRLRVSGPVLGPRVRGRRWRADRGQRRAPGGRGAARA